MSPIKLPSRTLLLTILIIIPISLFTLYPSFKLALFGDDWLAFVRYLYRLGPNPEGGATWTHLTYFLTPYGAQDILMGLLYKVYGYNSTLYYMTSYFLRLIAGFSLYPLTTYLTKSRLAAFFAVLFFLVTTTGFDTTNWVFNMPTYISIAFFNFFLLFYIRSKNEKNFKLLLPIAITYYLAYVIAPIRMHGVLPFIFLLELFWILKERNFSSVKSSFLRLVTVFLVFLFISYTGESNGPPTIFRDRLSEGLTSMRGMLSQGRTDFIFYPIATFGSLLLPYLILNINWYILDIPNFMLATAPIFLVFTIIIIFFAKDMERIKKYAKFIVPSFVLWWLVVFFIHRGNITTFNHSIFIILLTTGGYALISILSLLLVYYKNFVSTTLFIALAWIFASFFAPWWSQPIDVILTTHRYLIVSAVGVSILLSTIISLGKDQQRKVSLFTIMSLILILHFFSTRLYLKDLLSSHSQDISNKIWSSFPHIPEMGEGDKPRLFYFKSDSSNFNIVHDVITFGFPPHTGLIYKYYLHYSPSNNVATGNPQEIVSAVTDGLSLKAHGWHKGPIDVNQIYAFQLIGQDNLVDITRQTREELTQIIKNYKNSNP